MQNAECLTTNCSAFCILHSALRLLHFSSLLKEVAMRDRISWGVGCLMAACGLWLGLASLSAQAPSRPVNASAAHAAPRTPWGDPDLQGNYTNTYENGTPLERPDQFEGRRLEDVTGEELATLRRQIQQRTVAAFSGPIHAPDTGGRTTWTSSKGSQAWFVIDPEDGKIPPLTDAAQAPHAERAAAGRASGRGPADSFRIAACTTAASRAGCPGR
jgi:hypothetical protein